MRPRAKGRKAAPRNAFIQRRGGLVQKQKRRLDQKNASKSKPLLFPRRQSLRPVMDDIQFLTSAPRPTCFSTVASLVAAEGCYYLRLGKAARRRACRAANRAVGAQKECALWPG